MAALAQLRWWRAPVVLVTIIALTGCEALTSSSTTAPTRSGLEANAIVDYVVDGDTVGLTIGDHEERVRLIGIDTPEKAIAERNQVAECFGDEATAFTRSLLPTGTPVYVERDVVPRDDYGRLLAYVYRADDGVFINYEVVRHGYAQPMTIPPNIAFSDLFVGAARAAERDDLGLWSMCST